MKPWYFTTIVSFWAILWEFTFGSWSGLRYRPNLDFNFCNSCDMWIHNEYSFIAETQYETVSNTNCIWICPKCEFFNFSDSFFGEQVNWETEKRFVPLTNEKKDRSSPCGTNKSSFISGLKFISMNINSIRGKNWNCWLFFTFTSHML